ncbi:uncharacterized protein [Amphiura filiformis]|uniref:uncharacterized protein n=1 Tax=Amphiura filiformis TaxID=82378 RepID=UPI003B21D288
MTMTTMVSLLVATFVAFVNIAASQEVTLEFTSNQNDIKPGMSVLLGCKVIGSFNKRTDDVLIVKKNIRGETITIASKDEEKHPDAPDSILLADWYDSINTLQLIIANINGTDWGTYTCKLIRQNSPDSFQILAQTSLAMDFPYPPQGPPLCKTQNTTWYDGDEVTLQCTSDTGKPPVSLEWYQASGSVLPKTEVKTSLGVITATVTFNLNLDHNDVIFNCIRLNNNLSASNVSTCLLGPITVFNKTETALSLQEVGVIAGIAIVPLVIVILFIVLIVWLIRSKRRKSSNDYETPIEDVKQGMLLGGLPENTKNKPEDNNHEKLKPNNNAESANDAVYASVQKNKANGEPIPAGRKSKVYPNPPSYPRPPKSRESITVGEQYANSTVGANKLNTEHESKVNGVYQNSQGTQDTPSSKNSKYKPERTVYSNTMDVCISDNTDPKSAGTTGEYANTSDAVNKPKVQAPTQPPPPPPSSSPLADKSSSKRSNTPGLKYADLELAPASTSTARKSGFFNEPVVYAAVKS